MSRIVVKELTITSEKISAMLDGVRIVQLSDLHIRRRRSGVLSEARAILLDLAADVIVITGDFDDCFANPRRAAEVTFELLEGVTPPLGCFGVLGNHDDNSLSDLLEERVRILTNENVLLERDGGSVMLAGIDGRTESSWDLPGALERHDPGRFTLLLAHYPSTMYHLPRDRVDLMLSGHTHGGQFRVPGIGPLFYSISGTPRRYCRGLHEFGTTQVHVSAGLGTSHWVPVRIFCPPEISVITLKSI